MSGCACWHGGTRASQDCGTHPTHLGMASNPACPTSGSWVGRWLCVKLPAVLPAAYQGLGQRLTRSCSGHH